MTRAPLSGAGHHARLDEGASPSSPAPVPGSAAPRRSPWPEPGANVVLNDLPGAAEEAAEEIRALGGEALVVPGDVGERATADAMLQAATEKLGGLDIVVNNAGITRDKMLFNMTDEEFDLVLKVHLRGHFLLSRNAASYWRGQFKETGEPVDAAVVNTASEAFLTGSPGQANYAAAKAGITALTLSTARGLSRVGVRANAICPRARTAMTADVFGEDESGAGDRPLLARTTSRRWSPTSRRRRPSRITGQVFVVYGGMVALLAAPVVEQRFDATGDDLGPRRPRLAASAATSPTVTPRSASLPTR